MLLGFMRFGMLKLQRHLETLASNQCRSKEGFEGEQRLVEEAGWPMGRWSVWSGESCHAGDLGSLPCVAPSEGGRR